MNDAGKGVEALRLESANLMPEQNRLPIESLRASRLREQELMRQAFIRVHGEVPRAIRNEAGLLAML